MSSEDLESLIVSDESLLDPSVDTSRLRRTTDTRQELLGDLQPGLQYDPTLQSTYSDLLRYFSGDLDMAPTPVAKVITPTVVSPTDGGGGGGGTIETSSGGQETGGNTNFEQNLINQGAGIQIAPGQPVVAPGEIPVTQAEIDEFNSSSLLDSTSTAEQIAQDLSNQQAMLNPTGGNIMDEVALTGGTTPSYVDPIMDSNLMAIRQQQNLEAQDVDAQGNLLQTGIDKIKSITSDFDPVTATAKLAINTYVGKPISFVVDALQALPKSESQKEYEGYTDAQKGVIDEAYGAGGVMEGYNAVSTFGDGPLDTMTDRYNTRVSNGIIDATTTDLANKINALGGNVDNFEDGGDKGDGGGFDSGTGYGATGLGGPAGQGSPQSTGPTGKGGGADAGTGSFGNENVGGSPTGISGPPGRGGTATTGPSGPPSQGGGGNNDGGGKGIVCTMMNEFYGFGSFRNKIWLEHSKGLAPEYQKGYHKIFLPLVAYARKDGVTNKIVRKILEHIAIHRTIDIRQESRGKVHLLGRVYRKILEPICYWVGKHG